MISNKLTTLLKSKNLSFVEKKTVFLGIIGSAIFSRANFKKNDDLHSYISIYENEFKIVNRRTKEPGFAKYVYESRPMLFSRIANQVYKLDDINRINKLIEKHISYFEKERKSNNDLKNKQTRGKETSILADMELNNDDRAK